VFAVRTFQIVRTCQPRGGKEPGLTKLGSHLTKLVSPNGLIPS